MFNETLTAFNFSLFESWSFEDLQARCENGGFIVCWAAGCGLMGRGMCRDEMLDRTELLWLMNM
jgi:hypothetical protein